MRNCKNVFSRKALLDLGGQYEGISIVTPARAIELIAIK
jgi:hypothetical protein